MSLQGSETLKVYYNALIKYWGKGNSQQEATHKSPSMTLPHIIVPIMGKSKGKHRERCHLLVPSNLALSGFNIQDAVHTLLKLRKINNVHGLSQILKMTNFHTTTPLY